MAMTLRSLGQDVLQQTWNQIGDSVSRCFIEGTYSKGGQKTATTIGLDFMMVADGKYLCDEGGQLLPIDSQGRFRGTVQNGWQIEGRMRGKIPVIENATHTTKTGFVFTNTGEARGKRNKHAVSLAKTGFERLFPKGDSFIPANTNTEIKAKKLISSPKKMSEAKEAPAVPLANFGQSVGGFVVGERLMNSGCPAWGVGTVTGFLVGLPGIRPPGVMVDFGGGARPFAPYALHRVTEVSLEQIKQTFGHIPQQLLRASKDGMVEAGKGRTALRFESVSPEKRQRMQATFAALVKRAGQRSSGAPKTTPMTELRDRGQLAPGLVALHTMLHQAVLTFEIARLCGRDADALRALEPEQIVAAVDRKSVV